MTGYLTNGMYYNEGGVPNGEPLIFVHGTGFNTDVFDPVFPRMVLGYDGGGNSLDTLPEHMLTTALRDSAVFVEELNRIDNSAAWNNLPNVSVPLAFLTGERSIPLFRHITADLLASVTPNARVIKIPGGNHFAHVDMPDVFSDAVLQALQ